MIPKHKTSSKYLAVVIKPLWKQRKYVLCLICDTNKFWDLLFFLFFKKLTYSHGIFFSCACFVSHFFALSFFPLKGQCRGNLVLYQKLQKVFLSTET